MANVEKYDDLIIGSGIAGKFTAWTRDSRRRMAIVERGLLGGACPNVACLPSKNLIWSAKVISLARRGIEFGLKTDSLSVDMAAVQRRKRTKTISEPRGFMKALVAKDSDEILGFTAFAFEASELMVAMQTAMLGHLPYTVLRDAILTHPTMSEGLAQLLANVPGR